MLNLQFQQNYRSLGNTQVGSLRIPVVVPGPQY